LAGAAGERLAALGFHAQVTTHAGGVALFSLEHGRHAVRWHDGAYDINGVRVEQAALVERARTTPSAFSPNVLLRPLVQDTLFPTVCYVGGPAELAYQGQLRDVYAHFGIPMPLVLPRTTATVIDPPASRFLSKYDFSWLRLQPQDEHALNELLESQLPPSVEASLHAASGAIGERMAQVIAAVPVIDPTLEGAARSTLGRMEHDLKTLHNKIIHAAKKRDETLRRQFVRTRSLVFPEGHIQERTLGAFVFLNKYGPAFIDTLAGDLPRDAGTPAADALAGRRFTPVAARSPCPAPLVPTPAAWLLACLAGGPVLFSGRCSPLPRHLARVDALSGALDHNRAPIFARPVQLRTGQQMSTVNSPIASTTSVTPSGGHRRARRVRHRQPDGLVVARAGRWPRRPSVSRSRRRPCSPPGPRSVRRRPIRSRGSTSAAPARSAR
jgi:hypothetical protein